LLRIKRAMSAPGPYRRGLAAPVPFASPDRDIT
jgi:hypothetical protein